MADETQTQVREDDAFVAIPVLVLEGATEHVRCTRLATGQAVYDFWTDGKRVARIDANAYDYALEAARERMQDEPAYTGARVALATRRDHAS